MDERSPWKLGGLTLKELAWRVYEQINKDDVFGRAAQLAYYFLLALFPLLLFLTTLLGYLAEQGTELRENLLNYLATVVPGTASTLIYDTVKEISEGAGGGKLSFGILATLWAASNGMGAISESLNVAYNVKEARPWWKARLVAIGLTIALAVLIISALILVLYGHNIAEAIAGKFGLGDLFTITWKIVQWPIVLFFVLLGFALIYYLAPDIKEARWEWITPGSVAGVTLWLLVSFAFRLYLEHFDTYSKTYGSLGAVIVLMLWFYFTGAAILIGGEINSEIENAAAAAGHPEAKGRGQKAPDEQPAPNPTKQREDARKSFDSATASSTAAGDSTKTEIGHVPPSPFHTEPGKQPFTLRKVAVVAGAWVASKLLRKQQ